MIKVIVTTAIALSDKQRQLINQNLKVLHPEGVELVEKIDESILGGIRLRVGSKEFDSTLKGRLQQVKVSLLNQI